MRVAPAIVLTEDQERTLQLWSRGRSLPARQVERAHVILLAAAGKQDLEIAAELGISNQKAARWRQRFLEVGLAGLERDAPRPGRTPSIPKATVDRVIKLTTLDKPITPPTGRRAQWQRWLRLALPACDAFGGRMV